MVKGRGEFTKGRTPVQPGLNLAGKARPISIPTPKRASPISSPRCHHPHCCGPQSGAPGAGRTCAAHAQWQARRGHASEAARRGLSTQRRHAYLIRGFHCAVTSVINDCAHQLQGRNACAGSAILRDVLRDSLPGAWRLNAQCADQSREYQTRCFTGLFDK